MHVQAVAAVHGIQAFFRMIQGVSGGWADKLFGIPGFVFLQLARLPVLVFLSQRLEGKLPTELIERMPGAHDRVVHRDGKQRIRLNEISVKCQ